MLLVKSVVGFCERLTRRLLFSCHLFAQDVVLAMVVGKPFSISVATGLVDQSFELSSQERGNPNIVVSCLLFEMRGRFLR